MRIINSLEEARAFLTRRDSFELKIVPPALKKHLTEVFGSYLSPDQAVAHIINEVRGKGDTALLDYTRRIDRVELGSLGGTPDEIEAARRSVEPGLAKALGEAARRVRSFYVEASRHAATSWLNKRKGLGQVVRPLERVGVYVPGGTASYPSTVIHTVTVAKVAGVKEVIIATPPWPDGSVLPPVLAAAEAAGADRVFKMGGAQAIAAMAFGTESVPRVDKIVGPGNLFVMLAKKQVFGYVGIDGLHGPTETMIIADDSANPSFCAADLLAQAEHDILARPVLAATSSRMAETVVAEVEAQLPSLERAGIARTALENGGAVIVVRSMDEALDLANLFAPEHLCLSVKDATSYIDRVRNAGGVFVGEWSCEVLGDYNAGPSHVMPTSGTARFGSALGLQDFVKIVSVVALDVGTSGRVSQDAAMIAKAEGLTAHERAAKLRMKGTEWQDRSKKRQSPG